MAMTGRDAQVVQGLPVPPARDVTLGWFVKRSLLGIAILLVALGGLAWLTYASIDPTLDAEAATAAAPSPVKPVPVGF